MRGLFNGIVLLFSSAYVLHGAEYATDFFGQLIENQMIERQFNESGRILEDILAQDPPPEEMGIPFAEVGAVVSVKKLEYSVAQKLICGEAKPFPSNMLEFIVGRMGCTCAIMQDDAEKCIAEITFPPILQWALRKELYNKQPHSVPLIVHASFAQVLSLGLGFGYKRAALPQMRGFGCWGNDASVLLRYFVRLPLHSRHGEPEVNDAASCIQQAFQLPDIACQWRANLLEQPIAVD